MAQLPIGLDGVPDAAGAPIGQIVGSIGVEPPEVPELDFDDVPFRPTTDDSAVVRRTKAVAATRPLHDLERNKGLYEGDFWDRYDLVSMGIAVIDQVAMAMTVSAGMSLDEAHAFLAEQASRHSPGASEEERAAVAAKVLDGLVTEKPHEYVYVDHEGSTPVRHTYTFDLLYEQWNADETIHLRATPQAVNVLVSALDFDSDSAEAADEIQIRRAIDSGAFESAVTAAEHARFRSINDIERIRQIVRDTQLDPSTHDWAVQVPAILRASLSHIERRRNIEDALIDAIEERRSTLEDPDARRGANRLVALLRDCSRRHSELADHLITARSKFRAAQDERFRRPSTGIRRADVEKDLIVPALGTPVVLVAPWCEDLIGRATSLCRPIGPEGAVLIANLFEPPPEPEPGVELPDPDFDDTETSPWWEASWDAAEGVLAEVREPTQLSGLLARSRDVAGRIDGEDRPLDPDEIAVAVCHLAHELLSPDLEAADDGAILLAVPSGTELCDPAVEGDDLLVVPATIERSTRPPREPTHDDRTAP